MASSALALILLLAQAAAPAPAPSPAARREALLYAHCPRQGGEYLGSYRGRVVLHRELLGSDDVRRSIEQQLKYLWGHYRNDVDAHRTMQVVLSAEAPAISILARTDTRYGQTLALPYPTKDKRLAIEDPYTLRAVARGRVDAADPAVAVDYQIRFKVALCGREQDPPATVRVPLPPDPWLAYWHVPEQWHRPLRYFGRRAVTNPCADDDWADLPHPFYYWYDWMPRRHGPDDDGRAFDCRKWLRAGRDFHFFDVAFQRIGGAGARDLGRLRAQLASGPGGAPLTATVVVGAVDHAVTELDLPRWRALLGDGTRGELPGRATAALAAWGERPPRESGTRAYLQLLEDLDKVMTVEGHTSTVEDGGLVTEVSGRLRRSQQAVRARLWLGMSDIFGPLPPRHWPVLRRALAEDQIVVYWGHAGIGENFRLAQIEKHAGLSHAQMSAALRRSPLRLVAILSCYSYMYFGQDLLEAGAEREAGATFIFTGVGNVRREAGPVAVLDLVDRVVQPGNRAGRIDELPLVGDDELWLIKEVTGTAPVGRSPTTR